MHDPDTSKLDAAVLGQLLLMQNVLCNLPDEQSIFHFVCRGLADLPGVGEARHAASGEPAEAPVVRVTLHAGSSHDGELHIHVSDAEAFAPYEPYVKNFAFMVAVILEERHQRRLIQEHKAQLEQRVQSRTRRLTQEIADRQKIEDELQRSRNMLAHTLDSVPQAVFWKDLTSVYLGCNQVFARAVGFAQPDQVVGLTDFDLPWPRGEAEAYRRDDQTVINSGQPKRHIIEPIQQADGTRIWADTTKVPLCDEQGRVYGVLGVYEDITERMQAEKERARLQDELTQAQKMESVGRLAGGVAHDFNNMLQAIIGYADLALRQKLRPDETQDVFQEILKAARRSAELTRQLLAFARKQAVNPRVLDLNETVASMIKMLQRLIGEDIQLAWLPGKDLWPIKMDPVQIDQMLANLTVNARDSIRGTGRVTIETANRTFAADAPSLLPEAVPGDYVTLTISDTGCGMSGEVLDHLFEPFFTTKDPGKGTGLGLATVYGIVKQNQGHIGVQSEPGRGSSFTIALPRCEVPATSESPAREIEEAGGSETILLVEDEDQILRLTQRLLERLGYQVFACRLPDEALRIATNSTTRIDLVITDMVMPGLNGRELLDRLIALRPNIRGLFMSGYATDIIAHRGATTAGVPLLNKPFSMDDLAQAVRAALDQRIVA